MGKMKSHIAPGRGRIVLFQGRELVEFQLLTVGIHMLHNSKECAVAHENGMVALLARNNNESWNLTDMIWTGLKNTRYFAITEDGERIAVADGMNEVRIFERVEMRKKQYAWLPKDVELRRVTLWRSIEFEGSGDKLLLHRRQGLLPAVIHRVPCGNAICWTQINDDK